MYLFIDFCAIHPLIGWLLSGLLGLLLGWLIWGRLRSRIEELEAANRKLANSKKTLETELEECQAAGAQVKSEVSLLEGRLREKERESRELSDSVTRQRGIISDYERQARLALVGDAPDTASEGQAEPEEGPIEDQDIDDTVDDIDEVIVEEVIAEEEEVITDKGVVGGIDSDDVSIEDTSIDVNELSNTDVPQGVVSQDAPTESLGALGSSSSKKPDLFSVLKEDDLQVVEGIGPKMSEVLNNAGVLNWSDLASKSAADLRTILDNVNQKRYRIIDPSPWPQQAKLALEGRWDELISIQKNLSSGRKAGAKGETDSKVEKLLIKQGVLKRWKKDDLTAVEGIGPKISGLLKDAGIDTWRKLANAEVNKIQEVLDAAGKRYTLADPSTWPKQAEMAADGRFDDLQEYQDFLQGGR